MRHLSLFTGSGIGTLAAQSVGIVTVAHAENDPACCYCLERLWPGVRLFRDVRDVTEESVADLGPIDICSGGFPCTDISTAGKGAGLGTEENPTRSGLWYEFARVIREVLPTWVLIENVPALRVRGGDRVTNDLEAMAYEWEAVVVGAWSVGAPHKRDRVWIVGRLADRSGIGFDSCRHGAKDLGGRGTATTGTTQGSAVNAGSGSDSARLADPIGNLCGRGGDESERGPEGRTAAGRSGETVADAAQQREREPDDKERTEPRSGDARQDAGGRSRWPSRPGEPQHEWEAPRLVEFGVGDAVDGLARRVRSRANKSLLRMVGNAWCYPVAELIFRAIVELDQETTRCAE